MNSRPKNTDTMDDVLEMQNEYLRKKHEENLQPAAQVIRNPAVTEQKQSVFAKRRNLKQSDESDQKLKASDVVGEVVERKYGGENSPMDTYETAPEASAGDVGFPKAKAIDVRSYEGRQGRSIFSQLMSKQLNESVDMMETDEHVAGASESFHEENMNILSGMSEKEILEEQAKLVKSLDPKLLEFIRSKKASAQLAKPSSHIPEKPSAKSPQKPMSPSLQEPKSPSPQKNQPKKSSSEELPALDFLREEHSKNWLHFDILEPEKLEWTRNIEKTFANLKPGETYEARFDWKGLLQPYIENEKSDDASEKVTDDRELYLHGEDPQRPGYALPELFRLARATVLQQRVSAINAIAGIINIYNQGYYDEILELPISKMFFLLRLAMDENTLVIVEVTSRALAYLFYNDTDETLMDISFETRSGQIQPVLSNKKASLAGHDELEVDLDTSLKTLSIGESRKLFESKLDDLVDEEEQEKKSMNDFHLAEVNLVECLERTNILERISYIITVTSPNDVTIQSCVKILIRLARANREFASKILNKNNLINFMIANFLPSVEAKGEPHFIVLKLFRVLSSHDRAFCLKLKNLGVLEIIKGYVSTKRDVDVPLLKIQIESFRFLRLYFYLIADEPTFGQIIWPIRYILGWHFQQLDFQRDNHFIVRQHASSLLYLLDCGNKVVTFPIFSEILKTCASKWFAMATRGGSEEFSKKLLLSTVLDVAAQFVKFSTEYFFDFIDDYLMKFLNSTHFQRMKIELCESSPLFHQGIDRCNVYKALINVGSIVKKHKRAPPTLVLSEKYSVYFMDSLLSLINQFDNMSSVRNHEYHYKLCTVYFTEEIEKYLERFSVDFNRDLSTNWFLKTEINYIYSLLNSRSMQFNTWLLKVAFNLLNCLTQENVKKIFEIFKTFIFNERHYFSNQITAQEFERWNEIYNGIVMSKVNYEVSVRTAASVERWNQMLLNESWPYSLLLILLYNVEIDPSQKRIVETELTEEEIIRTSLKFTLLLENNNIELVSKNQQLMYIMLVYFGKELNFLDPAIKALIKLKLKGLKQFSFPQRFNMKLNKEKSFESLYTMFLDTFQSNSYGDDLFSTLVMIPLAQKYDVKWRKLVWSEYVGTMKFIGCKDNDLLVNFNEYLAPIETDESLLKCYVNGLTSHLLQKDSVPFKIAEHHVRNAKKTAP